MKTEPSSENENSCSDMECLTPPALQVEANTSNSHLIPEKSRGKYLNAYQSFMNWRKEKNIKSLSENVFLAYIEEHSNVWKPSTLWARYSMLVATIFHHHEIDISKYTKLKTLLKQKAKGFQSKKAKVFTTKEIKKFLNEAPDNEWLATKVIAVLGIAGACRSRELINIRMKDIDLQGEVYVVRIPEMRNSVPRSFTVLGNVAHLVKQYIALRPNDISTDRLFLNYKNGRCTEQVIGINKFRKIPGTIAKYLNLPNPDCYSSHSFRQTSATVLADLVADIVSVRRPGSWRSNTVAEDDTDKLLSSRTNNTIKFEEVMLPVSDEQESIVSSFTSEQESIALSLTKDKTLNAKHQDMSIVDLPWRDIEMHKKKGGIPVAGDQEVNPDINNVDEITLKDLSWKEIRLPDNISIRMRRKKPL